MSPLPTLQRALANRSFLASILLWTLACLGLAVAIVGVRSREVVRNERVEAQAEAASLRVMVGEALGTARGMARGLAVHRDLALTVERLQGERDWQSGSASARRNGLGRRTDVADASEHLAAVDRSLARIDGLYLVDTAGRVVAASDWRESSSPLGATLLTHGLAAGPSGRDERSRFAARGVSGRPGFEFVVPLWISGRVVGAVVAEAQAVTMSALFRDIEPGTLVTLTDSVGRLLVSSDSEEMARRAQAPPLAAESAFRAIPRSRWSADAIFTPSGGGFGARRIWVQTPLEEYGLLLHLVRRVSELRTLIVDSIVGSTLTWLVGVVVLVARKNSRRLLGDAVRAQRVAARERVKMRNMLDTSYDAVIARDAEGRVTEWNSSAEQLFGWPASEMLGRDPRPLLLPVGAEGEMGGAPAEAGAPTGRGRVLRELTLRSRDRGPIPVELAERTAFDADGAAMSVLFVRDISGRRAEDARQAAIRRRQDRFRAVLLELSSRDSSDWREGLQHALGQARGALGVTRASYYEVDDLHQQLRCVRSVAAEGSVACDAAPAIGFAAVPRYLAALREQESVVAADAWSHDATQELLRDDLRPRDIRALLDTPVWSEGRLVGVVRFECARQPQSWTADSVQFASSIAVRLAVELETAQRKRGERQLAVERERMRRIIESAAIPLSMWDAKTGVVVANPATLRLFRLTRLADLPPDATEQLRLLAPQASGTEGVAQNLIAELAVYGEVGAEVVLARPDGSHFPCYLQLVDLHEPGRMLFIASIVDLTLIKEAEAQMVAARVRAEDAEASKSAFLAAMSHEIRTPMNGVLAMSELLEATPLDDDQRSILDVVRTSADALLNIINDILDFSKIEAGKLSLEDVDTPVAAVLEDVAQLLAPRAEARGIALVSEIGAEVPALVRGDPTRLRQVLLNLAGNAIKFTDRGGVRLVVRVPAPDTLRFEVHDTGIGLTPEQQERLFQPFVQADASTSRRFGGTGLGLSISRRLCELMRGRIRVESTLGVGSQFWFEVPAPAVAPPERPSVDIRDLRVALLGFAAEPAHVVCAYAAQAGLPAPLCVDDSSPGRAVLEGQRAELDVVLAAADAGTAAGILARVGAWHDDDARGGPGVVLAVPRSAMSRVAAPARAAAATTMTTPVRRAALWQALAVASGRAESDVRDVRAGASVERYVPPERALAAAHGAVVLVAEDNATNQVVISRVLAQMGLAHDIVAHGRDALDALERRRGDYGLLLTDFHMPEMDGFELTMAWRAREEAQPALGRLPVLALSADVMAGMPEQCRVAGMDDYLTKPIHRAELAETIHRWLPAAIPLRQLVAQDVARQSTPSAGTRTVGTGRLVVIDRAAFAEQLGLEPGPEIDALLVDLVHSMHEVPGRIRRALTDRNREALRAEAHSVKGQARSVAAPELARLAETLQEIAHDASWGRLETQVERLCDAHAQLLADVCGASTDPENGEG